MAHLLIVDDDTHAAAALSALLRREGHEVAAAPSAGTALSYVRQNEPDLILLDLEMPRVDGLDLLDALADEPRFAHLRIALFTGRDDEQARQQARRLGACDYIVKGTGWDEISRRIAACLAADSIRVLAHAAHAPAAASAPA
jgi:DNA-binding response OmpR family regulator